MPSLPIFLLLPPEIVEFCIMSVKLTPISTFWSPLNIWIKFTGEVLPNFIQLPLRLSSYYRLCSIVTTFLVLTVVTLYGSIHFCLYCFWRCCEAVDLKKDLYMVFSLLNIEDFHRLAFVFGSYIENFAFVIISKFFDFFEFFMLSH